MSKAESNRLVLLRNAVADVQANVNAGRLREAVELCRTILVQDPNQVETLVNLSVALLRLGHAEHALRAADRAITARPAASEAHNARGNALLRMGRYDEALAAYEQSIAISPDRAAVHSNRASALQFVGRLSEAIAGFEQAIALQPGLAAAEANRLFAMHFHPAYGPDRIAQELRRWGEKVEASLPAARRRHENDRSLDRRLRVGYVSPDLRDHCLGRLMLPIVREHDPEKVETFFYSDASKPDATTAQFQSIAAGWRDSLGLSHDALAGQVRADRIDILVDLTLHMSGSRLLTFARRPAPVQVTYGGYPSGTGLQAMDYRLTDPYLDPPDESDSWYVEKSIRLPDCFWCYSPDGPHPAVNALPSDQAGFITFGCLNNFSKANDLILRLWANVLAKVDRSRLLLLVPAGTARRRTLEVLQSHSISPDRVEFVAHQPRDAYFQTYHRIDIGLDTFPYNGHTTSLDAFWMGVPVVTLVGRAAVGRAGWSQLSNLGLAELAALNEMQFVEIATALAGAPARLSGLRRGLRQRLMQSSLTDPRRFARNLEAAYRHVWRQWCEGGPSGPCD